MNPPLWLAVAATPADLAAARSQMALSLGWHIIIACFGVGMPAITVFTEWRALRRDDADFRRLAHGWARETGVLFAVGAVSGTILSFEMGVLWPGLMSTYGQVIGLPFAMEGFAFFTEAIFLGIYQYAWDRLPPRIHLLTGIPVCVAGVAAAFFVVSANAWMNEPRGFHLDNGQVVGVDPWKAMFNPATPHQTIHMILAAFMVAGFGIASVYAVAMARGKRDLSPARFPGALHRRGGGDAAAGHRGRLGGQIPGHERAYGTRGDRGCLPHRHARAAEHRRRLLRRPDVLRDRDPGAHCRSWRTGIPTPVSG
jgi:cytochrome d ubiquinol oxidase subunit I